MNVHWRRIKLRRWGGRMSQSFIRCEGYCGTVEESWMWSRVTWQPAEPLTNGLWQEQLTKARASPWILRTPCFFSLAFKKAAVRQLFDAKQTDTLHSPCGDLREINIGSRPPSGLPSSPQHMQGAQRPLPSLLPHFSAHGSSPTSKGPVRRATHTAFTNRTFLISPRY